jgi:hypothetical protein
MTEAKCMEPECGYEADAECEDCGREFCADHLSWGLCDTCADGFLGLVAPVRALPRSTSYRGA